MKRKLLLGAAVVSALLGSHAGAQVVNFHDDNNGDPIDIGGQIYNELFAGQGAYADPGNDIWNGFGQNFAYSPNVTFYDGVAGSGVTWPQQYGNPGNPYAAFYYFGWQTSFGSSPYNYATGNTNISGNSDSRGQWTPIALSVGGYSFDNIGPDFLPEVPNGSPAFLLACAAYSNGPGTGAVFTLSNVPPGTNYGMCLYGASPLNNAGTLFALNSGTAHNGIAATLNAGTPGKPAPTFVEGQDFVIFQNVGPDTNGNITIAASPNPKAGVGNANLSGQTFVNGFQLIFNPPPTALGRTVAQNVYAGSTANFSFSPAFAANPSFRWQFISAGAINILSDGGNVSGSATTNLTIANVSATNVGLYQCVITSGTNSGVSPAAPLTILTAVGENILQLGDTISDFNNNTAPPDNTIPPSFNMSVTNAEDDTLDQYENFGSNGSVAPFGGPAGFVVTPKFGASRVTGMRLFAASSHPEDDPADYLLEGSTDGTTFTTIAGGLLALPASRNAAGGPINVNAQVLQELDFANSNSYTTYRLTFTNVNNNTTASNGVQIAEIQLLNAVASAPPVLSVARGAAGTLVVSWSISVATKYGLQQSSSLNGPWSSVSATPVVVGSQYEVTTTIGTGTVFYRLEGP
jgi:hypothetical protein